MGQTEDPEGVEVRDIVDRDVVERRRQPPTRWFIAVACLLLVVAGVVVFALRPGADPKTVPPVASVLPETTASAASIALTLPDTTVPDTTALAAPVNWEPVDVASSPYLGTWITTDIFGRVSKMVVEASGDNRLEMSVTDFLGVCRSASTMTGTGRLTADSELVFPKLVLPCEGMPQNLDLAPYETDQSLTFSRDPEADTLTDTVGSIWTREGSGPIPDPAAPLADSASGVIDGFLEARIAGYGAQRYLNVPWVDIPLLYSTSSGASYERAEFETIDGIEWPYGLTAIKVRLFSGRTVVEQLFFVPAAGRLGLNFYPHSFGTDIAATTEDDEPVGVPYSFFNGEVTMQVAHPWIFSSNGDSGYGYGRLIPEGPDVRPTTDGGERNSWDDIFVIADPARVASRVATRCPAGPDPVDAEAFADGVRSDPGLEATAPTALSVGGVDGLMMDVKITSGTTICAPRVLDGIGSGRLMRLYVFDAPEGSSMRVLALAAVAPDSRFGRAAEAMAPLVDTIEFDLEPE